MGNKEEKSMEEKATKITLFRKQSEQANKIKGKDKALSVKYQYNELGTQAKKNSKSLSKNVKEKDCNLAVVDTKKSENDNNKSSTKKVEISTSETLKYNKSLFKLKKGKDSTIYGLSKLEKESSKSSGKREETTDSKTVKRSKSFFNTKKASECNFRVIGANKSDKGNSNSSSNKGKTCGSNTLNVKTDTLSKGSSKSSSKLENTEKHEYQKYSKENCCSTSQLGLSTVVSVKLGPQVLNNGGTESNECNAIQKLNKENTTKKSSLMTEKSSYSVSHKIEPQKMSRQELSFQKSKRNVKTKQTFIDTIKSGGKSEIQNIPKEANMKVKKPDIPKKPSFKSRPVTPITGERCGSWRPSDMVTMSSEKAAARRKTDSNNGAAGSGAPAAAASNNEDSPNQLVYKKMEQIVEKMQDEATGVPVKTVKSFMSKIPSVFTGSDLIMWMMKNLDVEDQAEALHLAHLMAAHGYFFPIDDHMLTVKNDNTFYRFQTPYFWPSNCWEPENTDYAVYLCKRTMQNKTRLELADYEAENLARLQKMFSRKWEFIFMQAEAQSKVDKKRDKLERKVLDSQERAFWDVHRPMPGCVNTTEVDIKKACRVNKPLKSSRHLQLGVAGGRISPSTSETDLASPTEAVKRHIAMLKQRLDRRNIKVSKVAEACIGYFEQYAEYDPFFTPPELPNPWISDSPEFWEQEKMAKDISARRVKRWAFSLQELLQDPVGREHFIKFLDKEFSGENLKFWEAVQQLKALPQKDVQDKVDEIWLEFLAPDASCPLNVDSQSYETTKKNMENLDRWSFDVAAAHVYHLMKSDSYSRYLRSEMYKEFLNGSKKKTSVKGIRSIVSFSARKESALS